MSARFARSLALLAGCVLSGACATTRYTESRIEAVPTEHKGKAGSAVSLEIEGLKVDIRTLDRTPEEGPIGHLGLRLVLEDAGRECALPGARPANDGRRVLDACQRHRLPTAGTPE